MSSRQKGKNNAEPSPCPALMIFFSNLAFFQSNALSHSPNPDPALLEYYEIWKMHQVAVEFKLIAPSQFLVKAPDSVYKSLEGCY